VSDKPSCINCPSFGTPADAIGYFGKSLGVPVCLRYGRVLGKPGTKPAAARKIAEATASSCSSFGEARPLKPERFEMQVAFPDGEVTASVGTIPVEEQARCKSCVSCANFVRDSVISTEYGWPAGLCSATGRLVLPQRASIEARNCEYRRYGTPRGNTAGIRLMPEFDPAFGLRIIDPITNYFKSRDGFVDPTEYPTDSPVSVSEEAAGIRAWRRVVDPEGYGDDIMLPVYDLEKFPDELQESVPRTGDDEHPELYVDHMALTYKVGVLWTKLDETPALWGQAGMGKTEFFRHMAWLMVLPFHRISITGSSELDDLAGKMLYSPTEGTYFQYGRLPRAWISPGVICIDEPNTGPADVWQFLRPLTDNSKQLVLDTNKGERLKRNDDSYLGMAMNPAWDPKNVGTLEIGDADANRLMHFLVQLPPAQLEREILRAHAELLGWTVPPKMLDTVMGIALSIRQLIDSGTLPGISWAIRPQKKVIAALHWFPPTTAYRMAIGDSLEDQTRECVLDQVKAHVSDDDVPWR
jgi:hypothetical protein